MSDSLKTLAARVLERYARRSTRPADATTSDALSDSRAVSPANVTGPQDVPSFQRKAAERGTGVLRAEQSVERGTERRNNESIEWWRELFEERAGVRQFDGGFDRAEAEKLALGDLVRMWISKHPLTPSARSEACVFCHAPDPDTPVLAEGGHAWLHHYCWTLLMAQRAGKARTALITMLGIAEDFASTQETSTIRGLAAEEM